MAVGLALGRLVMAVGLALGGLVMAVGLALGILVLAVLVVEGGRMVAEEGHGARGEWLAHGIHCLLPAIPLLKSSASTTAEEECGCKRRSSKQTQGGRAEEIATQVRQRKRGSRCKRQNRRHKAENGCKKQGDGVRAAAVSRGPAKQLRQQHTDGDDEEGGASHGDDCLVGGRQFAGEFGTETSG